METIHGLATNGPAIIGTGCAFTILAVLAVGLRIGSKRIAHNRFAIDDWVLVFALLLYFTAEILVIRCKYLIPLLLSAQLAHCFLSCSRHSWEAS